MKSNRGVILAVVAFVVASLSGAAGLLARVDAAKLPVLPAKPAQTPVLLTNQLHVPDCSDQDDDDDRDEALAGKPDTDDIELQCGDQDDDDDEIEDDAPGKHHEREKSHEQHEGRKVEAPKKVSGK